MNLPSREELKNIYERLQDDESRKIYRHRLLYSLVGEKEEMKAMLGENKLWGEYFRKIDSWCKKINIDKSFLYGAGAACDAILSFYPGLCRIPFIVVDDPESGSFRGIPVISFEEFIKLEDYKTYKALIAVRAMDMKEKIATKLSDYGVDTDWLFTNCEFGNSIQYFDLPELKLGSEYFVDAGALDGKTTEVFFSHSPQGHAYVLEPNPNQLGVVKETLRDYHDVEIFPCGAYSDNTTLFFENDGFAGSARISNEGNVSVQVRKLDDLLKGKKVTFVKMDIEGAELEALKGAGQIIRGQKPKLAICVYHKPEDMWEIPGLILSYNPEYKFYLRHYSADYTETVLYAI